MGKLIDLRRWWDEICAIGPHYGYSPNATKTWLITKKDQYRAAEAIFAGTGVKLTKEGRPHLDAPLGTSDFKTKFLYWLKWRNGVGRLTYWQVWLALNLMQPMQHVPMGYSASGRSSRELSQALIFISNHLRMLFEQSYYRS